MPVLRVLGAALTAVFVSTVPAMAQVGPIPVQPCESQDSAPPGGATTTDDAGADGAASETSIPEGATTTDDVTSTDENTMIPPDALVFDEQLGGMRPVDCEVAPSVPPTGTPLDTPLGAIQDSADQLVELLAII